MFQHPELFFALLLLIPLGLLLWLGFLRGRKDLKSLLGRWRRGAYLEIFTVKWFFSSLALLLFFGLIVLAMADPERRGAPQIRSIESRDVIFALDISHSMLAADSTPSRLERSVEVMRGLLAARGGTGRFGLVVFRGLGSTLIPVTEDLALFETVFQSIGPGLLTRSGSDISSGLETAVEAFPRGVESERFLFIFSDGENFAANPGPAVEAARERGIRIIAVGAGTAAGTTIPLSGGELLNDASGKPVVTRLQPELLQTAAAATDGEYYSLNDPALLRKMDDLFGSSSVRYNEARESAYQSYLGAALLSLAIYFLLRVLRWQNTF